MQQLVRRRSTRKLSCQLLAVMASVLTLCVGAFSDDTKDLKNASLEELMSMRVYSASKHLQSTSDAPSSVTVITREEIRRYGYRTLADILSSVVGFYVTYDRNYSFLGVRGFGKLGDWSGRTLLLVDGHRMNNNVLGQVMLGTEFPVDVDLIERVEVVRGPSSSLYGTNAFFGVINVFTRKSAELTGWEFSFEPASFGSYQGRASYGGHYKQVDMLLSGTFYQSEGQTLFYPEFNTPATNNGVTQHTDDEANKHLLDTFTFRGFTLQGVFSQREKGNPTAYFGSLFNDPRTRNFDDHQYLDLTYQHSVGANWQLAAQTSFDQYRLDAPFAYFSGLPDRSILVDKFDSHGNWWTGEVKLSRILLEKHKLTGGAEVIDNLRQDQGYYTATTNSFVQVQRSSWNWATYFQDEFAILRSLTLNAGVRYDRYYSFGGTTNPRLGLIYRPLEQTTLKLLYGSAFRAPEVYEIYQHLGTLYRSNPGLRPETIRSGESVIEQGIGSHFKLSGSIFRNRIADVIGLEADPVSGVFAYRNSAGAYATGTEIQFSGRSQSGLQAAVSFSYVDANDKSKDHLPLINSPRHLAKLNLAAPLFHQRLSAAVEGQYTDPSLTLANHTLGSFQIFNVTLLGHTFGRHMDISGSVYNILDKKYSDPGRPEEVQDAIQQDGRSTRLKMTLRF